MSELENKVEELLRRTSKTTKSRYRASERLEQHHKFSQWTVALISCALIFIPLLQTFNVDLNLSTQVLNSIQSILAVLVLVYSLLLGQENFISKSEAMQRNGVELGRLSRKIVVHDETILDDDYNNLVEEYYSILEKYENHKPIDYLFTRLSSRPKSFSEYPEYIWVWIRAQFLRILAYSHYIFAFLFVFFVFYSILGGVYTQIGQDKSMESTKKENCMNTINKITPK